jgi:hypothetical protein
VLLYQGLHYCIPAVDSFERFNCYEIGSMHS